MQWSKLKQEIEGHFADKVRGRVEVFSTQYNKPRSSGGRAWITIDGVEIVNFSTSQSRQIYGCYYHAATTTECMRHPVVADSERTNGSLVEDGEFSRLDFHNCCFEYLSLSIASALSHPSPLVNMLAVLDKRFGKRRIVTFDFLSAHPLVSHLYDFRIRLEGLTINK